MPEIKLTQEQYQSIIAEYNSQQNRHRLSQEQVEAIANKLNKKIDLPFISEKTEGKIFIKLIKKVDSFLYEHLPNEIYDSISSQDGISDDEAQTLSKRLTVLVNKAVNIPYVPEQVEEIALNFIISLVVNGMRKKWDLLMAVDNHDKVLTGDNQPQLA